MRTNYLLVSLILLLFFSGCTELEGLFNDDASSEPSLEDLMTKPKVVTLEYRLNGQLWTFNYTVYKGMNDYLAD